MTGCQEQAILQKQIDISLIKEIHCFQEAPPGKVTIGRLIEDINTCKAEIDLDNAKKRELIKQANPQKSQP